MSKKTGFVKFSQDCMFLQRIIVMFLKCNNLDRQKHSLHDREGDFNSRITVKVAHIGGNLEDVHEETEKPEQQKST